MLSSAGFCHCSHVLMLCCHTVSIHEAMDSLLTLWIFCLHYNCMAFLCILKPYINKTLLSWIVGRDSSVGTVTRYGLDGLGSNPGGGRDFQHPSRPAHPASCTVGTGSFLGVKRSGRGVVHPPPSSAEVKERVELYLCFPSGPSWPVLG